ncbi:MAG: hypothetical protein Q7R96_00995 [Nanoarchaeota archaeon]|nr:hypothetical protein [Nanoarchaeota archaeon]
MSTALHGSVRNLVAYVMDAHIFSVGHVAVLGDEVFTVVKKLGHELVVADMVMVPYAADRLESLRVLLADSNVQGLSSTSREVCLDLNRLGSFDWFGGIPSAYLHGGRMYYWL